MKKNILFIFLILIIFYSCQEQRETSSFNITIPNFIANQYSNVKHIPDSIIIRCGTSSGMCIGYCSKEFRFHNWGIEKIQKGWSEGGDTALYPTKKQIILIDKKDYQGLIALLDYSKFQQLDTRIGNPGATDASVEWIEIQMGIMATKRVSFETKDTPQSIKKFIAKMNVLIK